MHRVLSKAPVGMHDIVELDRFDRRRWRRPSSRIDVDDIRAERARVEDAAQGRCDSSATAALALVAETLQLVSVATPGTLFGECADVGWLVQDAITYLTEVRRHHGLVASSGPGGSG